MVRVVARCADDGVRTVAVDTAGSLPGRGAWLHRESDCVSAAVRRRAFGPALRDRGLTVNPDDLDDLIAEINRDGSAGNQDR
ncbi:YlxR family protein [Gordonia zhaorongruii]|uniref:YlxR family protein n=1 Tax=Gordonia zhaorongruii TaxID=2597659 RepID=UPI001F3F449D|nr:YlxR family protein [Gordonia zhaorongruii]